MGLPAGMDRRLGQTGVTILDFGAPLWLRGGRRRFDHRHILSVTGRCDAVGNPAQAILGRYLPPGSISIAPDNFKALSGQQAVNHIVIGPRPAANIDIAIAGQDERLWLWRRG